AKQRKKPKRKVRKRKTAKKARRRRNPQRRNKLPEPAGKQSPSVFSLFHHLALSDAAGLCVIGGS
ncbi:MAG: hypothetical protein IJ956_05720, partial [Akkermansia sp.]|nr:hypothetical protein [Akkermansia sp.]